MEIDKNKDISRRSFFKSVSIGLAAAISFILGFPFIESVVTKTKKVANKIYSKLAPVRSIPNSFAPIENPSKLHFVQTKEDAFIKTIAQEDVWVVKKADDEITVFSPICPHLGCRYSWNEDQKLFICPCHNSVYTIEGKVVSGPAPRGLDTLPIKIKDEKLYVLYERFEVGVPQKIMIGN